MKDHIMNLALAAAAILSALLLCEVLVTLISPQPVMYPRVRPSKKYYHEFYPGERMVHKKPGKWEFTYSINEYGHRGKAVPIKEKYDKKNVVVLGDSFAFGQGVNDGEEFPAVMGNVLGKGYDVINLSVGGYGLTQEIRKYYDLGRFYKPRIVLIVFCSNDPSDNFIKRVAYVRNGKIYFRDMERSHSLIKGWLSHSRLQKSQLFNLVFNAVFRKQNIGEMVPKELLASNKMPEETPSSCEELSKEEYYNDLMDVFVKDLKNDGVHVIFLSVDGEMSAFPDIEKNINRLSDGGYLDYVNIKPWLTAADDKGSPEGHAWGKASHAVIGRKMAEHIKKGTYDRKR